MKLSKTEPLAYGSITKEQFDKEIEKGMSDVKAGKVYSADSIEAEIKRAWKIAKLKNYRLISNDVCVTMILERS